MERNYIIVRSGLKNHVIGIMGGRIFGKDSFKRRCMHFADMGHCIEHMLHDLVLG